MPIPNPADRGKKEDITIKKRAEMCRPIMAIMWTAQLTAKQRYYKARYKQLDEISLFQTAFKTCEATIN